MKIEDINICMNVLSVFEDDAREFFAYTLKNNRVTSDGAWGSVSWWKDVSTKYLKTGAIACGGAALAAAAEFTGSAKDIPAEVYVKLWTLTAPSIHSCEAFRSMGSFGGPAIPSVRQCVKKGPAFVFEQCDAGKLSVYNALALIEYMDAEDPCQNRLVEYVIEVDERLFPLARFVRYNGGVVDELSKIC